MIRFRRPAMRLSLAAIGGSVRICLGLALAAIAPAARADTALLLVNDRYVAAQNLREAAAVEALRASLRASGFDVILVSDGDGDDMREGLSDLLSADEQSRLLIAAVGHFARSDADSWLLGTDVDRPDLATVGGEGLSLSVLLEVAARVPGRAVVLLGLERRAIELGRGLGVGIGRIEAPQGVTVIAGAPERLAEFATTVLLVPGADLPAALGDGSGLRAFGFVSAAVPFLPAAAAPLPQVVPPGPPPATVQPGAEETALWSAAQELNTAGAYRAYLVRYPAGVYAAEARARIASIENDPQARAEAAETALNLSREQRQQIQRSLSILDFDTRGIDGIFGAATRTAIRAWQVAQGLAATGYLDADQVNRLGQQAALRAAELEEQARIAREAAERADRAYWQVTGQGATEAGLRDYLGRYPDGLFAEQAEARLDEFERAARAEAEARDRAAWDVARSYDTVPAYRGYINDFPEGAFTDRALARIDQLTGGGGPSAAEIAELEAREAALNLPPVTRSLIEQRLEVLGLEPGRVDGRFDDRTRRAIRRYQDARGLPVTGYLDQQSVVRILAETVGGILRLDGVFD